MPHRRLKITVSCFQLGRPVQILSSSNQPYSFISVTCKKEALHSVQEVHTMPQYPGLYMPTPSEGQMTDPVLSQSTSILSATSLRGKQEVRSVDT